MLREGDSPNPPVFRAFDPADRTLLEKAVHGNTDRTRRQIDDRADRIDRQWTFMEEDFQHPEIRIAEAGIFTSGLSKTIGFWTYLGANRVETNPLSSAASPQ
jgi:hypothetical protein